MAGGRVRGAAGRERVAEVVAEGDAHHELLDARRPRVGVVRRVDVPPGAVGAVDAPADAGVLGHVGQEAQVVARQAEPFAHGRKGQERTDRGHVEPAREQLEQLGHGVHDRVERAGRPVHQAVAERRDPARLGLLVALRGLAEHGGHDGPELLELRADHGDVGLAERGVVAQQPQEHIAQDLDLSGRAGGGVHLDRPVARHRDELRAVHCVGPEVLLQAGQEGDGERVVDLGDLGDDPGGAEQQPGVERPDAPGRQERVRDERVERMHRPGEGPRRHTVGQHRRLGSLLDREPVGGGGRGREQE